MTASKGARSRRAGVAPTPLTVNSVVVISLRRLTALEAVAKAAEALRVDPDWVNMLVVEEYEALDRALDRLARLPSGSR